MSERLVLEFVDLSVLRRAWQELWLSIAFPPAAGMAIKKMLESLAFGWLANQGPGSALVEDGPEACLPRNNHSAALSELHIISSGDWGHVVFHPPTSALFRANERTASVLRVCKSTISLESVAKQCGSSVDEIESLLSQLDRAIALCPPVQVVDVPAGTLQKLVVNVSNDCTMRCRYCYAGGGTYGRHRALMTRRVACQTVDRMFGRYRRVGTVMFFGGEPALNPEVIQAFCDRTVDLRSHDVIASLPLWGIVTNGLVLSRRMERIVQQYDLAVTVSLDGPPDINNYLRSARDGEDPFRRIARNIRRIQEITGGREPSRIQATCTSEHQARHLGLLDLLDYFGSEFGVGDVHIVPVILEPGHPLSWRPRAQDLDAIYRATNRVVESWLTDSPIKLLSVVRCLHSIVTHTSLPNLCGAGLTDLTVLTNGDIYPCYTLTRDRFRMGNVADPQAFETRQFQAVQGRFRSNVKAHLGKCKACWACNLCFACLGMADIEGWSIEEIPDHVCAVNQATAESVLLMLGRIQADVGSWKLFCERAAHLMRVNAARHMGARL